MQVSVPVPIRQCWVDGVFGAHVLADDPAVTQGMAVFEVVRTYNDVPFRLERHLARLRDSANFFGIPFRASLVEVEIAQALSASSGDRSVSVTLTGGGLRVVRVNAIDASRVGTPIHLASCGWTPPDWLPGWVKHTSRAPWLLAVQAADRSARAAGKTVDEILFTDTAGHWTEANRSNVFVVRDGVLLTPPDDGRILRGVTRGAVLDAARLAGIEAREAPVQRGPCDELYVASTLKSLAPVVTLDGFELTHSGPVGRAVAAALRHLVRSETGQLA